MVPARALNSYSGEVSKGASLRVLSKYELLVARCPLVLHAMFINLFHLVCAAQRGNAFLVRSTVSDIEGLVGFQGVP